MTSGCHRDGWLTHHLVNVAPAGHGVHYLSGSCGCEAMAFEILDVAVDLVGVCLVGCLRDGMLTQYLVTLAVFRSR